MPASVVAGRASTVERENYTNNAAWIDAMGSSGTAVPITSLQTTGAAATVGSGGTGVSALSIVTGSTNLAGGVNATLTGVAPGVVVGVVAFAVAAPSVPKFVICSLAAPTAGVAAPPTVGADTYTTAGFTIRSYGPTTVTTGAYVINYVVFF